MTPISLLTKSNSIWGMRERPSAYRMTKLALPKFAGERTTSLKVEVEAPQPSILAPMKTVERAVVEEPAPTRVQLSILAEPPPATVEIEESAEVATSPMVTERPATIRSEPEVTSQEETLKPTMHRVRRGWRPNWNLSQMVKRLMAPSAKTPAAVFAPMAEPVAQAKATPDLAPAPQMTAAPQPEAVAPMASARQVANEPQAEPTPQREKAGADIWNMFVRKMTFKRRAVKVRGVQTELALDRVAPMRNDLSDADLEVIPRMDARKREPNPFRSGTGTRRAKKAKEGENAEPLGVPLAGAMAGKPTD